MSPGRPTPARGKVQRSAGGPPGERSDCPCGARWTLVRFFNVRRAAGLAARDLRERHEEEYQQLLAEHKEALLTEAEQEWAEHAEHRGASTGDRPDPVTRDWFSLSLELPADQPAPAVGDWIVTRPGCRYLTTAVLWSAPARLCTARPLVSYQLHCVEQPKHCNVPGDVRAIRLPWDGR